MRQARSLATAAFAALLTLPATGCLGFAIPYGAYPTLGVTPAVSVADCRDEVHVFRRDISLCQAGLATSEVPCVTSVSALDLESDGAVAPQLRAGLATWLYVFSVARNHGHACTERCTVDVALYRPGYETIIVQPWEFDRPLQWKPATTPHAQLAAVMAVDHGQTNLPRDTTGQRAAAAFLAEERMRLMATVATSVNASDINASNE